MLLFGVCFFSYTFLTYSYACAYVDVYAHTSLHFFVLSFVLVCACVMSLARARL